MNIIDYYIQLLSSPAAIHNFPDYAQELAALLPLWALLIWIFAISFAGRLGGRLEEVGTPFWVRFSWAWGSVVVIWYTDHLNGWQSVAPHCTLSAVGCGIAFLHYAVMSREVRDMQAIVSKTR